MNPVTRFTNTLPGKAVRALRPLHRPFTRSLQTTGSHHVLSLPPELDPIIVGIGRAKETANTRSSRPVKKTLDHVVAELRRLRFNTDSMKARFEGLEGAVERFQESAERKISPIWFWVGMYLGWEIHEMFGKTDEGTVERRANLQRNVEPGNTTISVDPPKQRKKCCDNDIEDVDRAPGFGV